MKHLLHNLPILQFLQDFLQPDLDGADPEDGSLEDALRGSDLLGRYGGDEFVLLLPETGGAEAWEAAKRIGRSLHDHEVSLGDGLPWLRVTASFGVASYPDDGQTVEALIASADAALYRAKASGGDVVASITGAPRVE